jgi:serine/threonine-protein kinase RsbW
MTLMAKFRSPAGPDLLQRGRFALERTWSIAAQVPSAVRQQVNIAAAEVLANIVEHGSGGGRPVNVEVEITVGPGQLQIGITDDGDAPDIDLDLVKMPDWDAERGRGLAMAKEVLADLTYRRVGASNVWTLVSKPF